MAQARSPSICTRAAAPSTSPSLFFVVRHRNPGPAPGRHGLDIYCTLLEHEGRRAWPRAYYSVQVKSTVDPWVFEGTDSVRWFIEHPLPIFLCIVQKAEARILVYHTTPRFAVWTMPELPQRLELILGTETQALTAEWA